MARKKKIKAITTKSASVLPSKEKIGILYFVIPDDISIDEEHVSLVRDVISFATSNKLYLVIDSSGGIPYAAVRIMRVLRKKFKEIYGMVPHQAMSAATLMLLGTNVIYMSEESQLGPLDLPMEHPIDGSSISALDVVQALSQLESTANEFVAKTYSDLRSGILGEKIGKEKAIEISFQHAEKMVIPLLNKIDPYHRQRALRKLKIGRWYATDLLLEGMMTGDFDRAATAAQKFVMSFPDHSYGIFRGDAVSICKLNIMDSENLSIWNEIIQKADQYISTKSQKIEYNEIEL